MPLRACIALSLLLSACATIEPGPRGWVVPAPEPPRISNLRRAATLPWVDDGRCAVQEASNPWSVLAERCFYALDLDKVRFQDRTGRCAVAVVPAIAVGVGVCLLAAVEIVAEAVVVVASAAVVAGAINAELDAYRRGASREPKRRQPLARPPSETGPEANREPDPEGSPRGGDWFPPNPPGPPEPLEEDKCIPKPVPPKGGSDLHNTCANNVPFNDFPGFNVLVNGKAYDALQLSRRTLWEVKTTDIENIKKYNPFIRKTELEKQVAEGLREQRLAAACGYQFVIGVRTQAHKEMLEKLAPDLRVVLMPWC